MFYAAVGPALTRYDIDVEHASLTQNGSLMLPANIQYVWPHASGKYFYVVSSNRGPDGGPGGDIHHLSAFRIEPGSGALHRHGDPVALTHRPIHVTTDASSEYALVAYCDPSDLTVHKINHDGTLGDKVEQSASLDRGIFAHQVRVMPSNASVMLVTRGHDAAHGAPERPGALKLFKFHRGMLSDEVSIAPNGGYGFGPRHVDFHPAKPWIYVSLERQHKLCVFAMDGDRLSAAPSFSTDTLADPHNIRPNQMAGTVHVHPNGRFVYGAERGTLRAKPGGVDGFAGGENAILVYAIDEGTGEPVMVQRMPTRGMHPRTFAIDPSGQVLVAANKSPVAVNEGETVRTIPASLDIFRIGPDGKLDYLRKYDVDVVGNASMFWSGFL